MDERTHDILRRAGYPPQETEITAKRIERETRGLVEDIFERKKRELGVEATLDLNFIDYVPVIDKYVYGEAFPEERRVKLDIFAPDATDKEITKIICEELAHIKYPEMEHKPEFWRLVRECAGEKGIPPEIQDIAETIRRECKTLEDLQYKVSVVRTRPYSRLAAIMSDEVITLADVCGKGPHEPPYSEVGMLYEYVAPLGICRVDLITVYRGGSEILAGDWVAFDRSYAKWHGEPVYQKIAEFEDIVWAGTDVKEWWWIPKHLQRRYTSLKDFWDEVWRS